MQYRDLFHNLNLNYEVYKELHNRTAELDRKIMKMFASGKNAVQISLDVPCAEATVYRAKSRVESFLQEELPKYINKENECVYIHNSIVRGRWRIGLHAHKLYYMLVHAHQNFRDHVEGKAAHSYMPGLKNQNQREAALLDLNDFSVILDEKPERSVKIFDFVIYKEAKYFFKFTREALPYHDKFYALLDILGIENWPE